MLCQSLHQHQRGLPLTGLGLDLDFNPGPVLDNPIADRTDLARLDGGILYLAGGGVAVVQQTAGRSDGAFLFCRL